MNDLITRTMNLLNTTLVALCPVLSGNMKMSISIEQIDEKTAQVVISAPFYDLAKWKQTGEIEHTGKGWAKNPQITDYAMWVNNIGAFGTHNKSEHWVNRTCKSVMDVIGSEIGGEVDCKLKL